MYTTSRMGDGSFGPGKSVAAASSLETSSYLASQLIEEMSNAELVKTVDNETRTNRHLFLENHMFERYLARVEPPALANLEQMMQQAAQADARQQRISIATSRAGSFSYAGSSMSLTSLRKPDSRRASASVSALPYEMRMLSATPSMTRMMMLMKEGPSINISHKIDMVTREMEELRISFEHLTKLYTARKAHMKAEIEEISTMVGEVKTTQKELIDKVVIKGIEPLTKKIPARVFVRFLEEWFRKMDLLSGQLRLKTNTYKTLYKKLSAQLEEKIELGETLNPVDFEFQEIQIQEVTKELHAKNLNLSLLKTKTANTHREFTMFSDQLAEEVAELAKLKTKTADKERIISVMDEEAETVQQEIVLAENALARIKRVRQLYTVPDVVDYARTKFQSHKLKREIRNWTRRAGLQKKELASTRKKLYYFKVELGVV